MKTDKSPDAFRTISEVSEELNVPSHVLRFWETKFKSIKPLKRSGNRRYYRPSDILIIKEIKQLLYNNGYTVKGVQKLLDSNHPSKKDLTSKVDIDLDKLNFRSAPNMAIFLMNSFPFGLFANLLGFVPSFVRLVLKSPFIVPR